MAISWPANGMADGTAGLKRGKQIQRDHATGFGSAVSFEYADRQAFFGGAGNLLAKFGFAAEGVAQVA